MKKGILVMGILLWLAAGIGMAEDPAAVKSSTPMKVDGVAQIQPASTASPAGKINPGDTAWVLMSAALVMLMTPGLALFYGGMVRGKNVLGTIMQSFMVIALISVQLSFHAAVEYSGV